MKKRNGLAIILFVIYLIIVFRVFFHDKKIIAVFASIGAAVYAVTIKRMKDSENE